MKRLSWLAALLMVVAVPVAAAAQQGTIQGTVVDGTSLRPLVGAQVFIPDTGIGTLTNQTGRFILLNVPAGSHTVRTSLIGYGQAEVTVTVAAGESAEANFTLQSAAVTLEGVVVTALGLERQARTLGVAAQQIDDDQLSPIAPSVVSSLSGQVSGVNITSATTQGGSSRIVIRGENSLLGNNQPLFIIDGIAVDNFTGTTQGVVADQGGYDYGTVINDLDPQSIESITVLKGPNAAALYGSRASNGAIVIETKKGLSALGGADITASQTVSWENTLRLPEYQNEYGQGLDGIFSFFDGAGGPGDHGWVDESWGAPLDVGLEFPQVHSPVIGTDENGRPILQSLPWVSNPDNIENFFETGNTLVTNVSVAAATDRLNGRLGFSRFDQDGIVPGFALDRTTVSFAGGMNATDRLNLGTSIQYITHEGQNRPAQGYDPNNPMSQLGVWFGRQVDMEYLRENWNEPFPEGHPSEGQLVNWNRFFWNNPFFQAFANSNGDTRDRLIGQITANYQFTPWLAGMARTGMDWYQDNRRRAWAAGNCCDTYTTNPLTASRDQVQETGAFADWDMGFQEVNSEFLLTANPELNLPFSSAFSFGGNRRDWERDHEYVWVGRLATPGVYNVGNAAVPPENFVRRYEKRVNSLYGQAEFGYNDYLFLTLTGRNDWSSTLPEDNNSYFYPSISGSFIFSDAIPSLRDNQTLSYGKLRASWARVGNDTEPYNLRNTYSADEIWDGNPTFTVPNQLLNADLKPEITESVELGFELGLLQDRLGLDVTYYNELTRDQIFNVNISPTTGYTSRWLNAGSVRNTGVELLLSGVPVDTDDVYWRTSVTWSKNSSTVEELAPGITGLEISISDFWGASIYAREDEPYGQIVGRAYQRSPDGRILVSDGGLPLRTPGLEVIGNFNPDWRAGWQNQVNFGRFGLSTLLDTRVGGDVFSVTKMFGTYTGVLAETAGRGRCLPESVLQDNPDSHYPLCTSENGIIVDGVRRVVNGSDTTYVENDVPISGMDYGLYNNYATHEANIIDGTFVKLRELTLSYDVPVSWIERAGIGGMQLALIGRNLWLWTPDENRHIDPETTTEASNVQGFEYGQTPGARSVGLTVTVRP